MLRLLGLASAGLLLCISTAAPAFQPNHPATQIEAHLAFLRPPPVYAYDILYGSRPRGNISFQPAKRKGAPLVIALSGYGPGDARRLSTEWIPARLYEEGFAFARISHDRGSRARFGEIVNDMLAGVARTLKEAKRKHVDTSRIILYGEGTSAQMAALFATDPSYVEAAGIPFEAIKAAVLVEGLDFDLRFAFAESSAFRKSWLRQVMGDDTAEWERLSPSAHLSPPNARPTSSS